MMLEPPHTDRLTLVIRGVADLTAELADALYDAAGGDCEVVMRDGLLYVEVAGDASQGWGRTPALMAAMGALTPEAELVRVEAADIVTAADRSHHPLRSAA